MRIFMDTEFTGLHQQTTLLSIGLITEDGKAFYRELSDYTHDEEQITGWIKDNVMPHLNWMSDDPEVEAMGARDTITTFQLRDQLEEWFGQLPLSSGEKIEMWVDTGHYDWVLFCNLWGNALNIPSYIHYQPCDLATFFKVLGLDPDTDRRAFADMDPTKPKHHALWDAVEMQRCHALLEKIREAQLIAPDLPDSPPAPLMADDIPTESAGPVISIEKAPKPSADVPQETTKETGEGSDTGETETEAPETAEKPETEDS